MWKGWGSSLWMSATLGQRQLSTVDHRRPDDGWPTLNLTETDKQSSVRFKAFEFIIQITKKYPELYNEVIVLAQDHYVEPLSAGIKSSMQKMIKSLEQI